MRIELDDVQRDAISKLSSGKILCGGTGSGKSRTGIAYYFVKNGGKIYEDGESVKMKNPQDLIIITTAAKRDRLEWETDELRFFDLSSIPDLNKYNCKVVIDSWNNITKYTEIQNAFFIFDEQRLISSGGVWVHCFYEIAKHNDWILLSATPGDKWEDYIAVFIANGFYKNKTDFMNQHAVYRKKIKSHYIPEIKMNIRKLERLRDSIIIDLPVERETVQHHIDVLCDYDKVLYRTVLKEKKNPWNLYKPIKDASVLCKCLLRICNSDESKEAELLKITMQHPKCIVFYNYDYELEILKNIYFGKDFVVAEWNGHKHEPLPNASKWVYLVQYTSGCEGWNCTTTDTIVFYSQNYSYKVMVQASGRIDRRNTSYKDLWYYHLKSTAPIDRSVELCIKQKKEFSESRYTKGMFN